MTKYVSQPVEVDAWQYEGPTKSSNILDILDVAPNVDTYWVNPEGVEIIMANGSSYGMHLQDWLIRRPNGQVSVISANYFPLKYTRVLG